MKKWHFTFSMWCAKSTCVTNNQATMQNLYRMHRFKEIGGPIRPYPILFSVDHSVPVQDQEQERLGLVLQFAFQFKVVRFRFSFRSYASCSLPAQSAANGTSFLPTDLAVYVDSSSFHQIHLSHQCHNIQQHQSTNRQCMRFATLH